jgi:hypothetical protein
VHHIESFEDMELLSKFRESAQAAPPNEHCRNVKEQKQCLATRALLAQVIARDKTARWSNDVDYAYVRHDVEATILVNFRVAQHLQAHGLKLK